MAIDTYNGKNKQAQCSECAKFMPWSRSRLAERGDGLPEPSPVYIEIGMCKACEDRISRELTYQNAQAV